MSKSIPIAQIFTGNRRPLEVVVRDADGEVEYKPSKDGMESEPESKKADTVALLKDFWFRFPKVIQSKNDDARLHHLWSRVDMPNSNGKGPKPKVIELKEPTYEWLFRAFNRDMPLTKDAKESGVYVQNLGTWLWGIHAHVIIEQLKDIDERKTLEELAELDGD